MKTFKELTEAFDKPLEYDVDLWPEHDTTLYYFKLSDKDYYRVLIGPPHGHKFTRKEHEVIFTHFENEEDIYKPNDPGKITAFYKMKISDALKVFATIIAIIKEHTQDRSDLTSIVFSADKYEESRVKLYHKLAVMAAKVSKWYPFVTYDDYNYTKFILAKKPINSKVYDLTKLY